MKNIDEESELQGNEYYRVICLLTNEEEPRKWLAKIRVKRKDTDEFINAGFTVFGQGKDSVMKQVLMKVNETLLPELEEAGIPSGWESEVRKILVQCKNIYSQIIEFSSYSTEAKSPKNGEEKYSVRFAEFCQNLIKESVFLSSKIEELSPDDRVSLLMLPESAMKDPSDAWGLEELDMRLKVFNFFLNPTDEELNLHNEQQEKLADRFKELGWS